ncbi:MAG: hypothetical protein AAB885_02585, partial [Patescibacteria group bacterium]
MLRPKSVIFIVGTALVLGMVFVYPTQASEGIFLKARNIAINGWSRLIDNVAFLFNESKRSLGRIIYKDEIVPIKVFESNPQTSNILDQLRNFLGEGAVIISKPDKTNQVIQPTLRDQVKTIVREVRTTTIDNSIVDSLRQDFNKYKETQQKFISELSQVSNVGPRGNVAYTIGNPTFTGTAQGLGDDDIPDDITVSSSNNASFKGINNIRLVNSFSGADAGAKIANCISDIPSTGGICDARGFEGSQTISSTITVNKPVTILLGKATFSASAAPFNITANGARIIGTGRQSIIRASAATFNVITISANDAVFSN